MVHAELLCSVVYLEPLSSFADDTPVIVISCVIGGFCIFICCVVGAAAYFAQHRNTNRRRSSPTVAATQVTPTPASTSTVICERVTSASNERVTAVQRRRHVTPTNPDAPPPYVASTNSESSKPPPYTADLINYPVVSSVEGAPTSQPLPPEFIPIENDLPPEYLPPPPESELEMLPLHSFPPTNPDASSDPPTSTADLNICSPHTSMQDTLTPQPLPPESSVSSNDENPLFEHHPLAGSDYEAPPVQAAPPMDVNAPPPCVPNAHLQSSNSAPCTSDLNSCFIPTSVEDTPTPQPLLPESPLPIPNDEDVELEYLPPPGSSA